jgi:hypothetical protein
MDPKVFVMSSKELDRLDSIKCAVERRITQQQASQTLGLSLRHVERLCRAYRLHGPAGLISKHRGKPGNHRYPEDFKELALALVREHYADFRPTFAAEKLREIHDIRVSRETLRQWMSEAGLWIPRASRRQQVHQPRHRRECCGELIQIDGSDHEWFEDRGPSRLMEMRFVVSESTFDYFDATRSYLEKHGKPSPSTATDRPFFGSTSETRPRDRERPSSGELLVS